MTYYASPIRVGTDTVRSLGDGYSITVGWFQATPTIPANKILYHIYYSTIKENVFTEGVKYVSIDSSLSANLTDLSPGQEYFVAVRPVEYTSDFTPTNLPIAYDNLRFYPTSLLSSNITSTALTIPLIDTSDFTSSGVVKIGVELIEYASISGNNLIVTSGNRGVYSTIPRIHNVDGYDGYYVQDPIVTLFTKGEDAGFDRIFACQCRFEYLNYPVTTADGYHQVTKDLLSTDLSAADTANTGFPMYDYAGYHRTDPVQLMNGTCVGSYIGGEMGCIDGYGNNHQLRGFSFQDHDLQRQEVLLSLTGRPAVLLKKSQTGITSSAYLASSEYPEDRALDSHSSKFVLGYEQFFDPRRSDGRIMVRVGPTDENLKMTEAGMESEFPISLWTLTVPTIKTRDIIVLFDQDDNEEFRYEVTSVKRNNTVLSQQGAQTFNAIRIRKFDPAYQIRIFRNTSKYPAKVNTGIGSTADIPPHTHVIVTNENANNTWSQTTSISQGHNHQVIYKNGSLQVIDILGHGHTII